MSTVVEDTPAAQPKEIEAQQEEHPRSALSSVDYQAELKTVQERLEAIEKEERTGADAERVALEELEKATKSVIEAQEAVNEKRQQLNALDESDDDRSRVQAELDQLVKDADEKEHQWSATKEVYYREFAPLDEDPSASITALKAKLQEEIASLQKQLELASIRRKQMAADAEEISRRLADQAPSSADGDGQDDGQDDGGQDDGGQDEAEPAASS
ncbi:hypothetical protein B0O80DRAFT_500705 [Mortierella sp. GBAus27b]|nr:hypothetical protein BGX31_008431 [Mortierella sp. GBA43]KAI8350513.1 hypothetical protein B0O80DRAFT_500705 [Mortierella sp. GBAus27b]